MREFTNYMDINNLMKYKCYVQEDNGMCSFPFL